MLLSKEEETQHEGIPETSPNREGRTAKSVEVVGEAS